MVGEASISLATACFGDGMNGDNGHDEDDVLYIAFPGSDAVPGEDGADWDAKNFKDFEESLGGVGDKLVARIEDTDSGASYLWPGTWGMVRYYPFVSFQVVLTS